MKLQQLFSMFEWKFDGLEAHQAQDSDFAQTLISMICFDARHVIKNSVFVALRGIHSDGHLFLSEAVEKGAIALVVEDHSAIPVNYSGMVLVAPSTRQILDILAARFYDHPSQKLFCIGVTGTNGKTSITYLLEHILNEQKKMTGVMGTVNHRIGEKIWNSEMTTPDPVLLQKRLREFIDHGAHYCAMEISSHALDQKRADSVHFNTAIFTNLTQDHLDYHKNMDDYFLAKQRLFSDLLWTSSKKLLFAVINIDDSYGRKIKLPEHVVGWTYGQNESDFRFKVLKMNFSQTEFELITPIEKLNIQIPLTGIHNVYNVVAAMAAALTAGVSMDQSIRSLKNFTGIPGRLQKVVSSSQKNVFIDYAHTPDALESTLKSLHRIKSENKLQQKIITVFGCGGDRDKSKRPLMAQIAAENSNFVFITSDNPRTESPNQIISEIRDGLPLNFKNFEVDADRESAIRKAICTADAGDVILIAGKGHEDYQILGDVKHYFSDLEVAHKYL